jgi:Uma2 family endonuclease
MTSERLYTVDDLVAEGFPLKHVELWDGVVCVREPSGIASDAVALSIGRAVSAHVIAHDLGMVTGSSGGFLLSRGPDRLLGPDTAFIRKERLVGVDLRRFFPGPPDFAVEVRSFSDRWPAVLEKAGLWVAHGVPLVWAVEPFERVVEVFRGIAPPVAYGRGDVLDGEPVLPGFRLPLDSLFVGLGPL